MRPILLACLALASAAAAADESANEVEADERDGLCLVAFPGPADMKLEISVRAQDTNLNLEVDNIPSAWVDGHEYENVAITVKPDKGSAVTIPDGDYVAGYTYRVEGWGLVKDDAMPLLSALKGGKSFTVQFAGHKAGPFKIQQSGGRKDYAYGAMRDCMDRNGGSTSF